jgi:hypothetical protein
MPRVKSAPKRGPPSDQQIEALALLRRRLRRLKQRFELPFPIHVSAADVAVYKAGLAMAKDVLREMLSIRAPMTALNDAEEVVLSITDSIKQLQNKMKADEEFSELDEEERAAMSRESTPGGEAMNAMMRRRKKPAAKGRVSKKTGGKR